VVTGFSVRSGKNTPGGPLMDDMPAYTVKLHCSNRMTKEVEGGVYGSYAREQVCPRGTAVCGMWAQYSFFPQVINVVPACCNVAADTCNPKDDWQPVVVCDNRGNNESISCEHSSTKGTSQTNRLTERETEQLTLSRKIATQLGSESKGLKFQFSAEVGRSKTTGHDWTTESSTTFQTSTTTKATFGVPAGMKKSMFQTVGACGQDLVHTSNIKFSEEY